ncbi:MAG TPA: VOC family protein [Thermomicrobiales bacterium]|nr:VOC family protein [Thermomicrobiales bacterium]
MATVTGLHHVTAIGSDPARSIAFYSGVLGLRLVKRSINQEDPTTWHLFFGNAQGDPGTAMTLIFWPLGGQGRIGPGHVAEIAFAIPPDALGYWVDRLVRHGVRFDPPAARPTGGRPSDRETVITLRDPDGLRLALVADPTAPIDRAWDGAADVPVERAVRGLHSATAWVSRAAISAAVLAERLGFQVAGQHETTTRLTLGEGHAGQILNLREVGNFAEGAEGTGTMHHIAWTVSNEQDLSDIASALEAGGLEPTPVTDRYYFQSIYVREPGGVLHEVATSSPGLTIDEPAGRVGETLTLPPEHESERAWITVALPPIDEVPGNLGSELADRLFARMDDNSLAPANSTEDTTMTIALDAFQYRFQPAPAGDSGPTLLLLHGTGGDENSLLSLGQALAPGAAIISPRGNVSENGAPRFFRRLAEGVLDQEDLAARTTELADWIPVVAAEHGVDPETIVAVGFSNGANIAASVLFRRPGVLRAAILLSPMLPFEPESLPDLSGTGVFIGAGRQDPLVPVSQVERLEALYREARADVTLHWDPGGHQVTMPEVEAARRFLASR